MPPKKEPRHPHVTKTTPARRKSKPAFEIPAETRVPKTAVGWVYRASETPEPGAVEDGRDAPLKGNNPFLSAAMGLLFVSLGTMGVMSVTAIGLLTSPVLLLRQMLTSE